MLLIETKRIFASLECRTWCRIIKVSAEMIVHVILAKRWNTFKKGHTETISDKTEVNSSVEKTLVGIFFDLVELNQSVLFELKLSNQVLTI